MRFGIVLPVWLYNPTRVMWAMNAFDSLKKTQLPSTRPRLLLVERDGTLMKAYPGEGAPRWNGAHLEVSVVEQPEGVGGTEQTLAWGTEQLFQDETVTHVVWMGDDALFNSRWLLELEALVKRHPEARSWSVYRSAHVQYHAPLQDDPNGLDVSVRSICGHGMTFSREEWQEWGIDWRAGQAWPNPVAGDTLDLHHAWARPGDRYVTKRSYVQHTGATGIHCSPSTPEYAIDFVEV